MRLIWLLIHKYIDKNLIFSKRKFFNLLLHKDRVDTDNDYSNYKGRIRQKYNMKGLKSHSKEKKIEYLRDSSKNKNPLWIINIYYI